MPTTRWQPPPRRRVYLLRHADVDYFERDGKPIPPDGVPLNEAGVEQARVTAQHLADVPFDAVVTSDMPRTTQTARIVLESRTLPIIQMTAFREIAPGRLHDLPKQSLASLFVDLFSTSLDRETRFLGGESFGSLQDRVLGCWKSLLAERSWQNLLVVGHGGVNRIILSHIFGIGFARLGLLEQDPCCVNILDVHEGERFIVRLLNHTCYNPDKRGLELTSMERYYLQFTGTHP